MKLTDEQQVACAFSMLLLIHAGFFHDSWSASVGIVSATVMLSLSFYLERRKDDRFNRLESQIKDLKERIDSVQLARGMGR